MLILQILFTLVVAAILFLVFAEKHKPGFAMSVRGHIDRPFLSRVSVNSASFYHAFATMKQGILGGLSGSVGNVTGSSWKGIAVLKSKPLSVANPQTAAQVAQRAKMTSCVAMLKTCLSEVIKPMNDRFASKMSGFNYALQESITAFDDSGAFATPANFKISRCTNKAQLIDAIAADANILKLNVSWTSDAGTGYALGTDKMYLFAYDATSGKTATISGTVLRSANAAVLTFPAGFTNLGCDVHVYMAALRTDGTIGFAQYYNSFAV